MLCCAFCLNSGLESCAIDGSIGRCMEFSIEFKLGRPYYVGYKVRISADSKKT